MSNLQTYYQFKLDFQKVDQHRGGKRLIHGTKRRKDNQLQSLELISLVCSPQTWHNTGICSHISYQHKKHLHGVMAWACL